MQQQTSAYVKNRVRDMINKMDLLSKLASKQDIETLEQISNKKSDLTDDDKQTVERIRTDIHWDENIGKNSEYLRAISRIAATLESDDNPYNLSDTEKARIENMWGNDWSFINSEERKFLDEIDRRPRIKKNGVPHRAKPKITKPCILPKRPKVNVLIENYSPVEQKNYLPVKKGRVKLIVEDEDDDITGPEYEQKPKKATNNKTLSVEKEKVKLKINNGHIIDHQDKQYELNQKEKKVLSVQALNIPQQTIISTANNNLGSYNQPQNTHNNNLINQQQPQNKNKKKVVPQLLGEEDKAGINKKRKDVPRKTDCGYLVERIEKRWKREGKILNNEGFFDKKLLNKKLERSKDS